MAISDAGAVCSPCPPKRVFRNMSRCQALAQHAPTPLAPHAVVGTGPSLRGVDRNDRVIATG